MSRVHHVDCSVDQATFTMEDVESNIVRCPDQEAATKMIDGKSLVVRREGVDGGMPEAVNQVRQWETYEIGHAAIFHAGSTQAAEAVAANCQRDEQALRAARVHSSGSSNRSPGAETRDVCMNSKHHWLSRLAEVHLMHDMCVL